MSYIRFSDIKFLNKEHSTICKSLLQEIQKLETQVMLDEEFVEYLANKSGLETAKIKYAGLNSKVLNSLKTAFWYYSGQDPALVILDVGSKTKYVDIFNPLD